MQVGKPLRWHVVLGVCAVSLSLLAACAPSVPTLRRGQEPSPPFVAVPASTGVTGQAFIGDTPFANAAIYVHDPIANAKPVAPGSGDGQRLEYAATAARTDEQGRFSLPLVVTSTQAAYLYISDGKRAVTALIGPKQTAYRSAGKIAFGADRPLAVDADSTLAASLLIGKMAALGKAAAASGAKGFKTQAKVLDVLNFGAGKATFKLAAVGGSGGRDEAFAQALATRMAKADPQVPAPPKEIKVKREVKLVKGMFSNTFGTKGWFAVLADDDTTAESNAGAASAEMMSAVVETNPTAADEAMGIVVTGNLDMTADATVAAGDEGQQVGTVMADAADAELADVADAAAASPNFTGSALAETTTGQPSASIGTRVDRTMTVTITPTSPSTSTCELTFAGGATGFHEAVNAVAAQPITAGGISAVLTAWRGQGGTVAYQAETTTGTVLAPASVNETAAGIQTNHAFTQAAPSGGLWARYTLTLSRQGQEVLRFASSPVRLLAGPENFGGGGGGAPAVALKKIAFQSNRDGNAEIYVMNVDGTNPTRLTTNAVVDESPAWSPDGTKLAWISAGNVWVMNADGTNPVQLTNTTELEATPFWSPSGNRLLYVSERDTPGFGEIYVMDAVDGNADNEGDNRARLTTNVGIADYNPRWSPNGARFAFNANTGAGGTGEIYVGDPVDADLNGIGDNMVRLTNDAVDDLWPNWSPDNTKLVFRTFRHGGTAEIAVMDAADVAPADGSGDNYVRLTTNTQNEDWPAWSPDGSKIVYLTFLAPNNQIAVMDPVDGDTDGNGDNYLQLTTGTDSGDFPYFSPDGSKIGLLRFPAGNAEIYSMTPTGGSLTQLTNATGADCQFVWQP